MYAAQRVHGREERVDALGQQAALLVVEALQAARNGRSEVEALVHVRAMPAEKLRSTSSSSLGPSVSGSGGV